jgi:hypothetical protein
VSRLRTDAQVYTSLRLGGIAEIVTSGFGSTTGTLLGEGTLLVHSPLAFGIKPRRSR